MKRTCWLLLLMVSQLCAAEVIERSDFVLGQTLSVKSAHLKETRTLNIYLPPSYEADKTRQFPVIYLLDGSADEDFIHVAGIVQFLSFPWIGILPDSIVVGIANVDRKRDFTYPSQLAIDNEEFPTSGGAAAFLQFIEQELTPLISNNYRVSGHRTLIGQSLGGLFATYALFEKPDLFSQYIIVSPSLWWDEERLLARKPTAPLSNKYIAVAGGKEGEVMERTTRALYDNLNRGNSAVTYHFLQDKSHGDALHMAVYQAFEAFSKHKQDGD